MSGQLSLSDYIGVEEAQFGLKAHGLRRLDARPKLLVCVVLVLANVLLARADFSAGLLAFSWAALLLSRAPLKQVLWFVLAPLWATSLVVAGFSVGFGSEPIAKLGPLTLYREGLMQGLNAGLRVLAEMATAAALVLTTPFKQLLDALRYFRAPEVLVETLGFMYRYIFLLFDEASSMRDAAFVRGGFSTRMASMRSTGSILAHIFLRAYDRSQRIAQAVRARGGA